ncbi:MULTISPECIES: hypothetical protein [Rhodopseudomonas]|uniref:Uncharacterized protein n=1 Tax=Rhodopseudomonas palustris TaxID=1076 RepID=A0A0D7F6E8_RHOPL|nr:MULTISPECIES: hypothetical protein [Rhodopseudomonas]KIZ47287.1 hypothetical protein OO17_05150 [Rhodopseudomonas palustris]MDF3811582.1 hypothetical protein [Rhodopseudomonas sp. BAL398]WOK19905.1 hypothetical protein RBJ75_10460 [Rhodopseudomonas sp. BAL398]
MARVYLFNPLISARYGPSQKIVVNSDATLPYIIKNTSPQIAYVPFSTSGARIPGNQPSGNSFVDSNTLMITNDLIWNYDFDLTGLPGDLIAYLFRAQIVLIASSGNYLRTFQAISSSSASAAEPLARAQHHGVDSTPGSVFVFNLFSEKLSFSCNGAKVADIPAWSDGASAAIYTPSDIPVAQVLNASDGQGKIFNGLNKITVITETVGTFSLPVDGNQYPLIQNLLLYLMRDRWFLFDEFGVNCESGAIDLGMAASGIPGNSTRFPT